MELTSAFQNEIVRPTLTLLVPGATAATPYLIRFRIAEPDLAAYLELHRSTALLGAGLAMLAVGLVLEKLGAEIEDRLDQRLKNRYASLHSDWYDYLRTSWQYEPVGQRYLRTITLHLKFELAMAPAILLSLAGFTWLNATLNAVTCGVLVLAWTIGLLLAIWLIYEASNSIRVLARVRFALISAKGTAQPAELT